MSDQPNQTRLSWLNFNLTPHLSLTVENVLAAVILLLAVVTRFYGLGDRVMSHDEINHVVPAFDFSQGRGYTYDPMSHGPLQYHMMAASYFFFGDNDFTARIPAALFSVATVAIALFLFRRYLGRTGALAAGLLFLISPYMLFYGRYTRNEAYIVVWGILSLYAVLRYLDRGKPRDLLFFVLVNAFHFTDKSTSYIFAAEQLLFLAAYFGYRLLRVREIRQAVSIRNLLLLGFGFGFLAAGGILLFLARDETVIAKIPGLVLAIGGLAAFLVGLIFSFMEIGWERVRGERSFDLLIMLGTLVLPLLAAVPMSLLGVDPQDLTSPNLLYSLACILLLAAAAAYIGIWWNWRAWLTNAGFFYVIFLFLYTTFLTNPMGLPGGFLRALGYWMEQQAVERGSQPWYYYLFLQIPVYEYLPFIGMILALAIGIRRGLWQAPAAAPFEKPAPADVEEAPESRSVPTLALLIFWSLANLAAFSYAGEKMPWLTVHIAAPMILAAGWAIGYLLETPSSSASQVARGWVTAFLALAAVFTARTAIQATYYNYDYAVEYLVYAHAAPAPKVMFNEIEKLSFEFTGSRDLVVAYDDDVRYPYWWYMRHYPNRIDFDRNPTSSIRDAAIIMVGEKNNQKVQPFLKGKYAQFRYARLWWPNMDYFSLKWDDIKGDYQRKMSEQGVANAPDMTILDYIGLVWDKTAGPFFTNSQFRSAAFQIWLNRDFTQWGQLMGRGGYSIADWGVADWMYVYIRKDYLERTSGMAIVQSAGSPETDPYQLARTNLLPDLSLGGSGSEPGQFAYPRGMAAASDGSFYVADSFNHRIQHFSADGRVLNAWGGPSQGAGADAAPGTFQEPWGVAVAPDGSVYVADTWNHRVQKFTADGRFLLTWGTQGMGDNPDQFYGPRAVAVDAQGRVYVADTGNKRIAVFDSNGHYLTRIGGEGTELGQLNEPVGLAIDKDGRVYVADTWNSRIQVFIPSADGGFTPSIAWDVDAWYGTSPENKPFLAVDANLNVYVTDPLTCRIIQFDSTGTVRAVWGECGETDYTLGEPDGLVITADGFLWVGDAKSNRLLRYALPDRGGLNLPILQDLPSEETGETAVVEGNEPETPTPSPSPTPSDGTDEAIMPSPTIDLT